jgi:predicted SAM-dependent methyltransferase
MYKQAQSVYKRLLMIPGVGPLARIPVVTWRTLRNRPLGPGLSPTSIADTLALTLAALDSLRREQARVHETLPLLEASLSAIHNRQSDLATELYSRLSEFETRIDGRVEFIRKESMYELRSQLSKANHNQNKSWQSLAAISSKIINRDLVERQHQVNKIRINAGCGHQPIAGYINVDIRELPGIDIVAEITEMPFETASVHEIYSSHLLEHFPVEHLRRVVLPYWRELLQEGGLLRAVVPDAEAMLADYCRGEMSFEDLREVTYGGQEYDGDFHYAMFTHDSLAHIIEETGFSDVSYTFKARRNGKCRDMEIQARRS